MTTEVLVIVALNALACAVVTGALGLLALRMMKRSSFVVQLMLVALAAIVSVVGGMSAVATQMYVSTHDLGVFYSVAAVAGLVSLVMAALLGRTLVRDSRHLRSAAERLGRGESVAADGDAAAPRHSTTEFSDLAGELAATGARLAESRARERRVEESRRELIAWISHDLRTPLAGIRAMAEALEDGMVEDPARYYPRMRDQVDRLSGMVDDLFELSRIHSGTLRLALEPVALYDLISDTVAGFGPVAHAKSLDLRFAGETGLTVLADPRELSRVVGNLVMNAIQHSPSGSPITVSVRERGDGGAVISVEDAAGGIPEQDIDRVFEAGWRASEPRTPGGAGLGLAIVQGIVTAHQGEVIVQNVPNGCRFDVLLPRRAVAV
ncbi:MULTISPECIES: sensor histidine kinase KdpD [Cryobacterium]|uniref:Sensor-like histidine kinase SenX3 n=1 Tax=Cryobacterium glucosi TaxID=1259175 RepID=A0ABY2IL58_9MICO|nr:MULTISPECIES: HAMP domain-containing sensor histidine kinase [Cryobacterium]MDY7526699.1 HAMP domain-containing sensor histidine kinase [Cryobacterium sp. 10C2]MEB0004803.1 HAMP domain-containing sensor histidine kinase [Cryobacterium sp. RTC2.1]MEB0288091.1 HAMP domain-containing sensor histidine kinase [Cryobacterium sp. 10S3]MEB0291488.1 HAMP domain-containing sensor histidine kinase [Cryobacterium sp. 10C2]MEB0307196.1 HAMP domain-containing sensor histidine kinase [Cryobacterium sp. 10